MTRFPDIPADQLTEAQKLVDQGVKAIFANVSPGIKSRNSAGELLGPFSPLLYTDDLVEPFFKLGGAVMNQSQLSLKEKEISVLAVLSEYDSPFVRYAHSEIAQTAGLSKDQIQKGIHAQVPDGLSEREAMVYTLALKMARLRGPMDSQTFDEASKILSREQIAGLIHVVSAYIQVVLMANVANVEIPPPEEGLFRATKNPALE